MSEAKFSIDCHKSDVNGVSFSQNSILSTCAGDKTVRLWTVPDFSEFQPISPLLGHSLYVNYCDFNSSGLLLATCSTDGKLIIWDLTTGRKRAVLEHPNRGGIRVCKFSPNSLFLVSGSDDETLCVWDVLSWRLLRNLKGHEAFVVTCAFSPDSQWMASGSNSGEIHIWDMSLNFGNCLVKEEVHDLGVAACDFSILYGYDGEPYENGKYLMATCGQDNLVKLWNVLCNGVLSITFTNRYVLSGHTAPVLSCCFSPHGKLLASGSFDKTVRLWNPLNGTAVKIFEGHTRYVTCCAFSHDAVFLASGSNDKTVKIWQIENDSQSEEAGVSSTSESFNQCPVTSTPSSTSSAPMQSISSSMPHWQKPINRWTVDEVCCWLGHIGYSSYEDNFRQNVIDGSELLSLTQESLEKSLRIMAYGIRNKIIRARDFLMEDTTPGISSQADFDYTPDEYLCPISREIMQDPVIAADGYTYERAAIESWIKTGNSQSPMTNSPLLSKHLTPNRTVKMLIQRHITS